MNLFRGDRGGKSKIRLLEALCHLVVSIFSKFEGCAAKTVGGIGLLRVMFFLKKHYCQISPHDCQFDGTDFKLGKPVEKWYIMLY